MKGEEELYYPQAKLELENNFAKLINSFADVEGFYPEELTREIERSLSLLPIFKKYPYLYVKWAKEKNQETKEAKND